MLMLLGGGGGGSNNGPVTLMECPNRVSFRIALTLALALEATAAEAATKMLPACLADFCRIPTRPLPRTCDKDAYLSPARARLLTFDSS